MICERHNLGKITEINGSDLDIFIREFPSNWSDKSIKNGLTFLGTFINYCFKKSLIEKKPELPEIPIVQEQIIRWLEPDEQLLVLDKIPRQHHPIFLLLSIYGVRPSEALGLNIDNVHFKENFVEIKNSFVEGELSEKTKTKRIRCLEIEQEYEPYLRETIGDRAGSLPLFINPNTGDRYTYWVLRDKWTAAVKKCGFDRNLTEGTRKSVTTTALNVLGNDVKRISRMMGNSPEVLLRHYGQMKAQSFNPISGSRLKLLKLRDSAG